MGHPPVMRRRILKKVDAEIDKVPALSGRAKQTPTVDTGRPFEVAGKDLAAIGGQGWSKLVKAAKDEFGFDEDDLVFSLEDTARRLTKTRPTEDQIVGTFIEVVAAVSRKMRSLRQGMVRASLYNQVRDMIEQKSNFFSNAGKPPGALGNAVAIDGFVMELADLPLTQRELGKAPNLLPKRSPGMKNEDWNAVLESNKAEIDAETERLVLLLEKKVIHARDTMIGSQEFVDRAALLPLSKGGLLLLTSEEYKAPKSGGGGRQTALRINRLYNANVATDTPFSYTPVSNETIRVQAGRAVKDTDLVTATMGQIVISSNTRGGDQILVKASASGKESIEIAAQRRSGTLAANKREYGDPMRKGKAIDVTYFKRKFSFPGRELRDLLKKVRKPRGIRVDDA